MNKFFQHSHKIKIWGGLVSISIFLILTATTHIPRTATTKNLNIIDQRIYTGERDGSSLGNKSGPTGFVNLKTKKKDELKRFLTERQIHFDDIFDLQLIRVRASDLATLNETEKTELIEQANPEITYAIAKSPNDPRYSNQSYLSTMNFPQAWDSQTGSSTIKVAVLDTGIMGSHEDLASKMVAGYNYVTGAAITPSDNSDDEGHGTIVAGIIGANTNNGVGVAGADWAVKIMPIKVIRSNGVGTDTNVASGIRWAVDNGASIINMSFGGDFSQTVKDQVDYAWSKGILMVASSGNSGTETKLYPAGFDEVLAVGSVSSSLSRSSFSNYGSYLDVVAVGESIISTNNSGGYSSASGTSISTPFVTGLASLIKAQKPTIGKDDVYKAIRETAKDVDVNGNDKYTGVGVIQAASAIQRFLSYHFQHAGQSPYPEVAPGASAKFTLIIKNTGDNTWQKGVVNLGTDLVQDRISPFTRESGSDAISGWISPNRIALQEDTVAPGALGTYVFWLQAPSNMKPGTYREYFRPVADGIGRMEDLGIYWDVKVLSQAEQYKHQFVSQNAYPTALATGSAYQFTVTVKNTGTITWTRDVVHLGTSRDKDHVSGFARESSSGATSGWVSANRIQMQESSVAPGATATFSFWLRNDGRSPNIYKEYFQLVADGVAWMEDLGIYWDVTVP